MIKPKTKPRTAVDCDRCKHFAPEDGTDRLCVKDHKPRLYGAGTYYGGFKRRCEDFQKEGEK
jgi:hypothetical protein